MKSDWLRRKRKVLGLSQFKLAKISGVSRFKISAFESSYIKLTGEEIKKVQKTIAELIKNKIMGGAV